MYIRYYNSHMQRSYNEQKNRKKENGRSKNKVDCGTNPAYILAPVGGHIWGRDARTFCTG